MKKEKRKSFFKQVKEYYQKGQKSTLVMYLLLRAIVIICMVIQFAHGNSNNVFLCFLTLILFAVPYLIDKKLKITIPGFLEITILLFIFAAEILGEIQNFYGIFKHWDTMLHTINGFLCGAIGFSLIDILNRTENFHIKLTPVFVALVSFCFSMTIGVLWEFYEFASDYWFKTDMQKDRLVTNVSSVFINEKKENIPVLIKDINETTIRTSNDEEYILEGGYLDIGIIDTMKDLLVNFIGAVCFSIIGLLYIKDRDEYRFAEKFMPMLKKEWFKKSNA